MGKRVVPESTREATRGIAIKSNASNGCARQIVVGGRQECPPKDPSRYRTPRRCPLSTWQLERRACYGQHKRDRQRPSSPCPHRSRRSSSGNGFARHRPSRPLLACKSRKPAIGRLRFTGSHRTLLVTVLSSLRNDTAHLLAGLGELWTMICCHSPPICCNGFQKLFQNVNERRGLLSPSK